MHPTLVSTIYSAHNACQRMNITVAFAQQLEKMYSYFTWQKGQQKQGRPCLVALSSWEVREKRVIQASSYPCMPNITLSCFSRCKPSLIRKRIVCWFFSYRFLSISDRIVCSKSPRECGGARRAERRAARNNRIECPLNRNARRSRGGALTAMFTRARLYALPYPFSQASHASALLYCNNRIYDLLKFTTASAWLESQAGTSDTNCRLSTSWQTKGSLRKVHMNLW